MDNHLRIHPNDYSRWPLAGLIASAALVILALLVPGLNGLAWVALLPAAWGLLHRVYALQKRAPGRGPSPENNQAVMPGSAADTPATGDSLQKANEALQRQVEALTMLREVTLHTGTTLNRQELLSNVIEVVTFMLRFDRAFIFLVEPQREALMLEAYSHPMPSPEQQFRLDHLEILLADSAHFDLLERWIAGHSVLIEGGYETASGRYTWAFHLMDLHTFFSVPLQVGDSFLGVILVDNKFTQQVIDEDSQNLLKALAANISIALENARLYQLTDEALNKHVQELATLRQVDRELNDALSVERVMSMTLDWGLRLTGAHAALLAVVTPQNDELVTEAGYGFDVPEKQLLHQRLPIGGSILGRAVRFERTINVPNVSQEPDYQERSARTRSLLVVPVFRQRKVMAVLSLESRYLDGFTTAHQTFVEQLVNRAAVALDNANNFAAVKREREKLSSTLAETSDAVIVAGFDGNVVLLNQAALAIFRLHPHKDYTNRPFDEVFAHTPLAPVYQRIRNLKDTIPLVEEVVVDETRYFHTHISPNAEVGWVIVMHDVTPFKETEKLKSELVATVSHDLKNPLSVINGYIELIAMQQTLSEQNEKFLDMIRRQIRIMRQLIDDLLDLAQIDSGMNLNMRAVQIGDIIHDTAFNMQNMADEKSITVNIQLPDALPRVQGDAKRLQQIISNLLSNAIKYTPPEGLVWVTAEPREKSVLVSVRDTGLGISPEDQAQVFERFYRVRRPETDSIEGTGLGLAIVKSLVEAHGGEIGLKSHIGEGSTFHFTVPRAPNSPNGQREGVVGQAVTGPTANEA